jgi:hypothetical protein
LLVFLLSSEIANHFFLCQARLTNRRREGKVFSKPRISPPSESLFEAKLRADT